MYLKYSKIDLFLEFEKQVDFKTYPTFVFHSVLGKELKRLTCIFKNRECSECSIRNTCPYSIFFVTPIEKDNKKLKGRNKAPHPYIISTDVFLPHSLQSFTRLVLTFTIFGDFTNQFPYLYYSILKAGQRGVFKERVKYSVKSVKVGDKNILQEDGNLDMTFDREIWEMDVSNHAKNYLFDISFVSPLRLKYRGKFLSELTFDDIINASFRRVELLTSFYGKNNGDKVDDLNYDLKVKQADFDWLDYNYYSARQRERLKLGGVIGNMQLEGLIDGKTISVLKAAELFHIGKNPSFGLGKVKVEVR